MPFLLILMMAIVFFGYSGMMQVSAFGVAFNSSHQQLFGENIASFTKLPFASNMTVAPGNSVAPPYVPFAGHDYSGDAGHPYGGGMPLRSSPQEAVVTIKYGQSIPFFGNITANLQGVAQSNGYVRSSYDPYVYGTTTEGSLGPVYWSVPNVGTQMGLKRCVDDIPVIKVTPHWTTCSDTPQQGQSSTSMVGIGTAMHLVHSNLGRTMNGVFPSGSGDGGALFWEALHHQQLFAAATEAIDKAGAMPPTAAAADLWAATLLSDPALTIIPAEFDAVVPSGGPTNLRYAVEPETSW